MKALSSEAKTAKRAVAFSELWEQAPGQSSGSRRRFRTCPIQRERVDPQKDIQLHGNTFILTGSEFDADLRHSTCINGKNACFTRKTLGRRQRIATYLQQ